MRLRHWDTLLLESDHRVGGRIRSERRGQYWLNGGGHVFAGPGTSTDALLNEVGIAAVAVPGSLKGPVDERQVHPKRPDRELYLPDSHATGRSGGCADDRVKVAAAVPGAGGWRAGALETTTKG
jgi:monoamine oxidase